MQTDWKCSIIMRKDISLKDKKKCSWLFRIEQEELSKELLMNMKIRTDLQLSDLLALKNLKSSKILACSTVTAIFYPIWSNKVLITTIFLLKFPRGFQIDPRNISQKKKLLMFRLILKNQAIYIMTIN